MHQLVKTACSALLIAAAGFARPHVAGAASSARRDRQQLVMGFVKTAYLVDVAAASSWSRSPANAHADPAGPPGAPTGQNRLQGAPDRGGRVCTTERGRRRLERAARSAATGGAVCENGYLVDVGPGLQLVDFAGERRADQLASLIYRLAIL